MSNAATREARVIASDQAQFLTIVGGQIAFRVTADDTDGAFFQFELRTEVGMGVPTHVHDYEDEAFYVLDGTVRFVIDGVEIIATPGTSVFAPRGLAHSFEVIGDRPLHALVTVTPGDSEPMFRGFADLPPGPEGIEQVVALCARYGIRFA